MSRTIWKVIALIIALVVFPILIVMLPVGYGTSAIYAAAKSIADAALACFEWAARKAGVR